MKKFPKILIWLLAGLGYLLVALAITSCDVTKEAFKQKNDVTSTAKKVTKEKIDGGSISTTIIPEDQRPLDKNGKPKDTIYKVTRNDIHHYTHYRADGSVSTHVDCPDGEKTTIEESTTEDNTKIKEKETEHNFDAKVIIYGFIGLGFLLIIVALFVVWQFKPLIKSVNQVAQQATKF